MTVFASAEYMFINTATFCGDRPRSSTRYHAVLALCRITKARISLPLVAIFSCFSTALLITHLCKQNVVNVDNFRKIYIYLCVCWHKRSSITRLIYYNEYY